MIFERTIRNKVNLFSFRLFAKKIIPSAKGISLENIITKIDAKISEEGSNAEIFENELTEFVRDYLIFNRKIVYSVKLSEENMEILKDLVQSSILLKDKLDNTADLDILGPSELNSIPVNQNEFIASYEIDDITCLLFTSRRYHEQRVTIPASMLRNNNNNYEQIYGIEKSSYQSFDSIIIDSERSLITFCIDNVKRISQADHYKRFNSLRSKFIAMMDLNYDDYYYTTNFFPLIDKYYWSGIGSVKSLSFRTNTSSRKTEKMDRSGEDLRHELFHNSGVEAVDLITGFSIEMVLTNSDTGSIIFQTIPGTSLLLSNPPSRINFYELIGAINYSDYSYIHNVMADIQNEVEID